MKRVHLWVSGRVQGVFFRQSLKVVAIQNSVTGWVRNLPDGRVEAILEGEEPCVEVVVEWARRGPANSQVTALNTDAEEYEGGFDAFEVLY